MIRMPDWIVEWLQARLLAHEVPGIRVLRSRWPLSVHTVEPDGRRVTSVAEASTGAAGEVRIYASGQGRWTVDQFMRGQSVFVAAGLAERDALALYRKLQRRMLSHPPAGAGLGAGWRWAALALAVLAVMLYAPGRTPHSHSHDESHAASHDHARPTAGVAAETLRDPREPRVTATEMTMLKTAASRSGISLADAGEAFYIFSDPNCPFCQQLERTLEKLGSGHKPVIIPVAYKQGSKEIVQDVLCAKDRKASTKLWRQAVARPAGEAVAARKDSGTCAEGLGLLTDNMTLFEMLKLTGTPTVITASGRMYSGASGATVEQLRAALELP